MLSTIRTIFAFNKNLTLDLPSALTWVFLYNHRGPCGVILCFLEMMIIKRHLLSDVSSIWLPLPLWCLSLLGYTTGLSILFFFCIITKFLHSSGESQHIAIQLLFTVIFGFLGFVYGRGNHRSPLFSADVLAGCVQVSSCLSNHFSHMLKSGQQHLSEKHWIRF